MEKLKYKTFVWPHNPHTYRDEQIREPLFRKTGDEDVFYGMTPVKRTITGSGVFFGGKAYEQFRELEKIFTDNTAGDLIHPVWGKCHCYFTALELTQEPRNEYVSYRFTFTGALPNGEIPR